MYIIFSSPIQITIRVELSVMQTMDQIFKENLRKKKQLARQKLDEIDDEFLPENNSYVKEMLAKEKLRKQNLRLFEEKLRQKRREVIIATPKSCAQVAGPTKGRFGRALIGKK